MINRNDEKEIYLQLFEHLKSQIASGDINKDSGFPSIRKLMAEFELSSATVTRAVNMLCDEGVLKSVPKRGYIILDEDQNKIGEGKSKKYIIAFVTDRNVDVKTISDDPIFTGIFNCLEKEEAERKYDILQVFMDNTNNNNTERFDRLLDKVDGVYVAYSVTPRYYHLAKKKGVPFIGIFATIKEKNRRINFDNVTIDRKDAFFQAANHLIQRGHQNICFVDAWQHGGFYSRYEGFTKAFTEHSIPLPENNILITNGWSSDHGSSAFLNLQTEKLPTAFVCSNDVLALGIIKGIQEKGLRIPEDISVIGAKNTVLAQLSTPPLTSIDYLDSDVVGKAVSIMHDRIAGDKTQPYTVSFRAKLINRSSCRDIS